MQHVFNKNNNMIGYYRKTTLSFLRRRGFTLIETIVTVAIFAVVTTALSGLIQYFYRTNAYVFEETSAVQSAHNGIINAMRDLKEASYGADGSYPVASAATSTITFYVGVNGSSVVDKIHYYLLGTTLSKGVTMPTGVPPTYVGQTETVSTIATYIRNSTSTPIFRYYDSSGSELTSYPIDVSKIASVNTTITVNLNPDRSPNDYTLSAGATLRNLSTAQ